MDASNAARSTLPSPARPWWRRWFGTRSERAAARFLKNKGWHIVGRNYTCPLGELDLIAVARDCVVFVEVRSTEAADAARPAESVDLRKQKRLTDLALHYLQRHRLLGRPARFDVLAVSWPPGQRTPVISHVENAFEAVGRFQTFS